MILVIVKMNNNDDDHYNNRINKITAAGYTLKNHNGRHCGKSVRVQSYFGPYFPALELNTERYRVSLRIQSE